MLQRKNSVAYLDGIRGLAAFGVFLNHFSLAFYPAYFTLKPETSHLNGYEIEYTHSLYSFLNNGGFYVAIFFVLSGMVLSRKHFKTGEIEPVVSGLHRRFIRLYIPIAFAILLSAVLMKSGMYTNDATSRITMSEWFIKQWRFGEIGKRLWNSLSFSTMFAGDSSFDTCLWTISYEFYGSLFVYAFLLFTHYTKRFRLLMMFLAMYYFYVMDMYFYMTFAMGMTLCYTEQWIENRRTILTTVLAIGMLILSGMFGSFPFSSAFPDTWQETVKTMVWDFTPWTFTIGAYLCVLAFVLSPLLQKTVSFGFMRFLGYISFSLYLLHPILLGAFSSTLFLKLQESMSYNKSVLVVFLATTAVLIPASWLMARTVDQYGIKLAQRVYQYVRGTKATATETTEQTLQPQPAIANKDTGSGKAKPGARK